jgi:hypothetical protein
MKFLQLRLAWAAAAALVVAIAAPSAQSLTVVRHPYWQQVTERSAIVVWATRQGGTATAARSPP